ncbi:MAG TPA: L-threonylcarbamoyladenylate synthase [Acidimicrobiales bacterium]|nr:L-threonylcarbamoyladenylate synthase [Acidimicrobiales bacterium]
MTVIVDRNEAVRLLTAGDVVAVPTDTVYGLAASLERDVAVAQIFSMKHRPSSVALPVLVDTLSTIERMGVTLSPLARKLSEAFWPGALTIVMDAPSELARRVGSHVDTVGFRVPNDELLRQVLAQTGPLVVSSANEHSASPCHSVEQVLAVFGDADTLKAVLDGGERSGVVSTVVQVHDDGWQLLREGAIDENDVSRVLA